MNDNKQFEIMDLLSIYSVMLGYQNLMENRQQSAHNDVQAANDKQAKVMLEEIRALFDEQNKMLKQIIKKVGASDD